MRTWEDIVTNQMATSTFFYSGCETSERRSSRRFLIQDAAARVHPV
jgi:hypothetical protein